MSDRWQDRLPCEPRRNGSVTIIGGGTPARTGVLICNAGVSAQHIDSKDQHGGHLSSRRHAWPIQDPYTTSADANPGVQILVEVNLVSYMADQHM
jgi:hypothetical protein